MRSYEAMADVYDRLMSHVDYESWVSGLEETWRKLGEIPRTVLDAGCGTGSVLLGLARKKYHLFGADNSPEMLAVCQDKLFQEGLTADLLEMDIRETELPYEIDAAVCLCDTLNYFTDGQDLKKCFESINCILKPGGSFIFDMRTPHYYRDVLAGSRWVEDEGDVLLIWDNDFSADPLIDIGLTFFVRQKSGLYKRFDEVHRQRCFEIKHIKELAEKSGFEIRYINADLQGRVLRPESDERMYFVTVKL